MTLEEALMTYLLAQPQVSSLIGSHLYSEIASTKGAEQIRQTGHPYCVFTQKNGAAVEHMTGVTTLHDTLLGVDVYAYEPGKRATVATALANAFHTWRANQAGHDGLTVRYAKVLDEVDEFIPPTEGSEKGIYQRSLDVRLWYFLS